MPDSSNNRASDNPHLPPAVHLPTDPDAAPLTAEELSADDGGDNADGAVLEDEPDSEIDTERTDAGEARPRHPATLLPPD